MAIEKIIIDNSTQAKELDLNTIQLDLVAYPYNESNQKEPDAEFKVFVNNQLFQNLNSDIQWNIKENLIIRGNYEKIAIKLQDIKSGTTSDIKEILLGWNIMETNDSTSEKAKYITQLKLNPNSINNLPARAKDDSEIVKYAVEQDWNLFCWVGEKCKNNKELIFLALKQHPQCFNYVSDTLKTNEEFCLAYINKFSHKIIPYFSNYMKKLPKIKDEIYKAEAPLRELEKKFAILSQERQAFADEMKDKPKDDYHWTWFETYDQRERELQNEKSILFQNIRWWYWKY